MINLLLCVVVCLTHKNSNTINTLFNSSNNSLNSLARPVNTGLQAKPGVWTPSNSYPWKVHRVGDLGKCLFSMSRRYFLSYFFSFISELPYLTLSNIGPLLLLPELDQLLRQDRGRGLVARLGRLLDLRLQLLLLPLQLGAVTANVAVDLAELAVGKTLLLWKEKSRFAH